MRCPTICERTINIHIHYIRLKTIHILYLSNTNSLLIFKLIFVRCIVSHQSCYHDWLNFNLFTKLSQSYMNRQISATVVTSVSCSSPTQRWQVWLQSRSDWSQMGEIRESFRSDFSTLWLIEPNKKRFDLK